LTEQEAVFVAGAIAVFIFIVLPLFLYKMADDKFNVRYPENKLNEAQRRRERSTPLNRLLAIILVVGVVFWACVCLMAVADLVQWIFNF